MPFDRLVAKTLAASFYLLVSDTIQCSVQTPLDPKLDVAPCLTMLHVN